MDGAGSREIAGELPDGTYMVKVSGPPAGADFETGDHRPFVVAAGTTSADCAFKLSALDDAVPDDDDAAPDDGAVSKWLSIQLLLAVVVSLAYWVAMLSLPENDSDGFGDVAEVVVLAVGVVLILGGLYVVAFWRTRKARLRRPEMPERLRLGGPIVVVGLVLAVVSQLMDNAISLDDNRRFALAVGGTAIAGLVVGLTRFTSIRAAASVTIVILFIGVTTFPDAQEAVGTRLRDSLITWMAVILGVNATAEAVTQVAQTTGQARVAAAEIAAGELDPSRRVLPAPVGDVTLR